MVNSISNRGFDDNFWIENLRVHLIGIMMVLFLKHPMKVRTVMQLSIQQLFNTYANTQQGELCDGSFESRTSVRALKALDHILAMVTLYTKLCQNTGACKLLATNRELRKVIQPVP